MAASTLYSFLVKLGFDVTGLSAGERIAQSSLSRIGAAARSVGAQAAPSTAALNNLVRAVNAVQGTTGARATLSSLAAAVQAVGAATGGSAPAMNAFARAAVAIGASTESGAALNAFARAAAAVATATGSPAKLNAFARAATEVAASGRPERVIAFANSIRQLVPAAEQGVASLNALRSASLGATGAMSAAGAGRLIAGFPSATGAIAATGASTGPVLTGISSMNGAIQAAAATTGTLVAGLSGMNGALAAAAASTGPVVAGLSSMNGAMEAVTVSTVPLVAGVQTMRGAVAATAASMGPIVTVARGVRDNMAVAGGAGVEAAVGIGAAGAAAAAATPPLQAVGGAVRLANQQFNATPGPALRAASAVNTLAASADNGGRKVGYLHRTLSMAFAFMGGVAVTTAMAFASAAIIGFNSRLEQARIAFTTFFEGSTEKADAFIRKMKDFANITPFQFQGLEEAIQRLMAMGFTAEQTIPILQAVGDAVAAMGGGKEQIDRITLALGQMMAAGKVNAQDMRQLTEALIPAWQILAKAMGKSVAEVMDLSRRGLISSGTALVALMEGMNERYGGMMAKQARTFQGALSTVIDTITQTISKAVEPLFQALSAGMVALGDFFVSGGGKYVIPVIQALGVAMTVWLIPRFYNMAVAANAASASLLGVKVQLLPLTIAIAALGIAWQENLGGIRTVLEPVLAGLVGFAAAVVKTADSVGILTPILTVLATLIGAKYVAALAASTGAMLYNAVAAAVLGGAFKGLTFDAVAVTTAVGAGGLMGAVRGLATFLGGLAAVIGGPVVAAIALFIAAIALLLLNFDRVVQGLRVLHYHFLNAMKGIVEAAASIPIIGEAFKGLSADLASGVAKLIAEMADAEDKIAAKATAMGQAATPEQPVAGEEWKKFIESLKLGATDLNAEEVKLVDQFGTTLQGVVEAAKEAGGNAMVEMAKAIRDKQDAPLNALRTLREMALDQMDPTKEITRLYAMLQMPDIAAGLASQDAATRAQTEGTVKIIKDRLSQLLPAAYAIGLGTGDQLVGGLAAAVPPLEAAANTLVEKGGNILSAIAGQFFGTGAAGQVQSWANDIKSGVGRAFSALNLQGKAFVPTAEQIRKELEAINEELNKTANAEAISQLNSAFSEIRQAANEYFAAVHRGNLQAIDDAVRHKNAILDAKAALNQAPVTAAQSALDFRRQQIEEFRLREAVRTATSPEAYRDAVLALQDFLAQQHIDEMQAQVDAANAKIDAQKAANETLAERQRAAENTRYEMMQRDFERQLELLRRYLEKHPGEWQSVNDKILKLLKGYGFDYGKAGKLLGAAFVANLKEQLALGVEAVKAMALLIPGTPGKSGGGGGRKLLLQRGAWDILADNTEAVLHRGELVAPADVAGLLRAFASRRIDASIPASTFATAVAPVSGNGRGGGTLIFQIGDEKLAELTDQQLYVQESIYGPRRHVTLGSQR